MPSVAGPPVAVVDANVGVWATLPLLATVDVRPFLAHPARVGERRFAPDLWLAECVSAIRAYTFVGDLGEAEGSAAIDALFRTDVELVPLDRDLCHAAYRWSGRLRQRRAYDGFYLALAEHLATELWTADRRLLNASRALGLTWVRWAGST